MIDRKDLTTLLEREHFQLSEELRQEQSRNTPIRVVVDRLETAMGLVMRLIGRAEALPTIPDRALILEIEPLRARRGQSFGQYVTDALRAAIARDTAEWDAEAGRMAFARPAVTAEEIRAEREAAPPTRAPRIPGPREQADMTPDEFRAAVEGRDMDDESDRSYRSEGSA